ncbi:hypothetical protein [Bacillus sp. MRMR6]|nr:hypothetical protein [Bacillus sp. MRMR6]
MESFMKSTKFKSLITKTEGLSPTKMYVVPLDDVKEADPSRFYPYMN